MRQARQPALYAEFGAPDTAEGRFELLTMHVILILERLREGGKVGTTASQALFDVYVSDLDGALREMGVGDLTVGKRMKALGGAFYGRGAAYREAFGNLPDEARLRAVLARTVFDGDDDDRASLMAGYVARCRQSLADQDVAEVLEGAPAWPELH